MTDKEWKTPKFKKVIGSLYKTKYNWFVTCPKDLKLGKNTDIGIFSYINARYGVIIEDDVQIGSHVSIYSHDTERNITGTIIIRKGTLIGSHVTILPRDIVFIIDFNIKAGSVIYFSF